MTTSMVRAAIVGASSLLGKELADELNRAGGTAWDLTLLDNAAEGAKGAQVTAAGDEAIIIQLLTPDSFAGVDVVFFASTAAITREHWRSAVAAGAGVVDLTGALAQEPGVTVRASVLAGAGIAEPRLDLATEAVVAAHSTSLMLSYVGARLRSRWAGHARFSATVLLPASEQGKEGIDELHAQTVALLSFQPVPREVYDAQVTFNLNAGFGPAARADLDGVSARAAEEVRTLLGSEAAALCAFQCVQAPVFHGCTASIHLAFEEPVEFADLVTVLELPAVLAVVDEEDDLPSNITATEQDAMQARLRTDAAASGKGFWLWLVADDLRFTARNAIACATELLAMRPAAGRVR